MAQISLSDLDCRKAKCPKGRSDIFDALTPGLNLRVTANKKSWCFFYTPPGGTARARMALGTYPATSLEEARKRAVEARGHVEAGRDPRHIEAPAAELTIAQLIDNRIRLEVRADAKNHLSSCMEIERCYDKDVIPVVGAVLVKDFRISHLNRVIYPIVERGAPTQANRVWEHMRDLLTFAVRSGEIPYSPMAAARKPCEENVKDRWLTLEEIRILWSAGALSRSDNVQDILRLILATGQRPGEVAGMERSEIDTAARLWVIPKHRSKNGHEHHVPLNDLALAIITERLRETNGDFLFPNNAEDGSTPNYTVATTLARALEPSEDLPLGRMGIAKFTPHDLRRTLATQMSMDENRLAIDDHYISYVLNHRSVIKKSITQRVYIVNQHIPQKREALDKWGAFLAKLVGADVEMREAA